MERIEIVSAWRNHSAKYQGLCKHCGKGAPVWMVNVRCEGVMEEKPAFGKVHKVMKTVWQYLTMCGACKAKLVQRIREQPEPDERGWLIEKRAQFEKERMKAE